MRIVVLGATGATGRHVLTVALDRGHQVVALARRATLSRVAWMGTFGAGDSRHRVGPLYDFILRRVLGDGFADKEAADAVVAGPRTTLFHPVMLTDRPATGEATVVPLDVLDRSWRLMPPKVTRADVAAAMVTEIESPAYVGRTVAVY